MDAPWGLRVEVVGKSPLVEQRYIFEVRSTSLFIQVRDTMYNVCLVSTRCHKSPKLGRFRLLCILVACVLLLSVRLPRFRKTSDIPIIVARGISIRDHLGLEDKCFPLELIASCTGSVEVGSQRRVDIPGRSSTIYESTTLRFLLTVPPNPCFLSRGSSSASCSPHR